MLKVFTTLSMFLAGHLAQAQTEVQSFTKIDAQGKVTVILKKSDQYTVNFIEGSGEASAETIKGVLTIVADPGRSATVEVSAPEVSNIRASESVIKVNGGLSEDKVAIKLTDGASINGNLEAGKLKVAARSGSKVSARIKADSFAGKFSGKSMINLSGNAKFASLDADGGTICLARNLIADRASVRAAGKSDMTVNTLGDVRISVDETAKITCIGARTPSIDDTHVALAH